MTKAIRFAARLTAITGDLHLARSAVNASDYRARAFGDARWPEEEMTTLARADWLAERFPHARHWTA
jgi:hypothetical protein